MAETLAKPRPDTRTAEQTRDRGLDAVRVLALALMVGAHYSWFIPASTASADAFNFICETAPAFFFFAFGMTFDRFARKDRRTQVRRALLLLWVAVAHNLLINQLHGAPALLHMDFFAFLWASLVVLSVIDTQLRPSTRAYAVALGVGVGLALTPWGQPLQTMLERGIPGHFPLYPWGLFVIAGLLYSRARHPGRLAAYGAVAIVVGTALVVLDRVGWGLEVWELTKRPMSASYLLLMCGSCALVVAALGRKQATASPDRIVVFLSSNLLLCTVLHYIPVQIIGALSQKVVVNTNTASALGPHSSYVTMWLGAAVCFALLWPLTVGVTRLWDRLKRAKVFIAARTRQAVTALLLLAVGQASVYGAWQVRWRATNGTDIPGWIVSLTPPLVVALLIIMMTYAALRMRDAAASVKADEPPQSARRA